MTLSQIISGSLTALVAQANTAANANTAVNAANAARGRNRAHGAAFPGAYFNSYARLSVVNVGPYSDGERIPTKSMDFVENKTPQNEDDVYIDYITLQNAIEVKRERMAPSLTLAAPLMMTSGTSAMLYSYSGIIIVNQIDGDQKNRFYRAYENFLRATQLVDIDNPRIVELTYRDQVRRGYLTQVTTTTVSGTPNEIGINFGMFVTSE